MQPRLMYDENNTPKLTSHGYFSYILISISPIIFCTNVHYCIAWQVWSPGIVMQSYLSSIYIQKKIFGTVQPHYNRVRKTPDISCTSVGNKIVDHSDVVGTSPVDIQALEFGAPYIRDFTVISSQNPHNRHPIGWQQGLTHVGCLRNWEEPQQAARVASCVKSCVSINKSWG